MFQAPSVTNPGTLIAGWTPTLKQDLDTLDQQTFAKRLNQNLQAELDWQYRIEEYPNGVVNSEEERNAFAGHTPEGVDTSEWTKVTMFDGQNTVFSPSPEDDEELKGGVDFGCDHNDYGPFDLVTPTSRDLNRIEQILLLVCSFLAGMATGQLMMP